MTEPDAPASPGSSRVAGVPARMLTLADGQPWGMALPSPRYRPEMVAGVDALGRPTETIRLAARIGYPAAIERLLADLRAACRVPRGPIADGRRYDALMTLASMLLRRAHDLSVPAAAALLALDDAGLAGLVEAVVAITARVTVPPSPGSGPSPRGGDDA